jgi:hypothetical protein
MSIRESPLDLSGGIQSFDSRDPEPPAGMVPETVPPDFRDPASPLGGQEPEVLLQEVYPRNPESPFEGQELGQGSSDGPQQPSDGLGGEQCVPFDPEAIPEPELPSEGQEPGHPELLGAGGNLGEPSPDVEKIPGAGTEKSDQVPDSPSDSSLDFQGFGSSSRGSEPSSEGVNRDSDFQGIESNQTSSSDTSEQPEPASTSW